MTKSNNPDTFLFPWFLSKQLLMRLARVVNVHPVKLLLIARTAETSEALRISTAL